MKNNDHWNKWKFNRLQLINKLKIKFVVEFVFLIRFEIIRLLNSALQRNDGPLSVPLMNYLHDFLRINPMNAPLTINKFNDNLPQMFPTVHPSFLAPAFVQNRFAYPFHHSTTKRRRTKVINRKHFLAVFFSTLNKKKEIRQNSWRFDFRLRSLTLVYLRVCRPNVLGRSPVCRQKIFLRTTTTNQRRRIIHPIILETNVTIYLCVSWKIFFSSSRNSSNLFSSFSVRFDFGSSSESKIDLFLYALSKFVDAQSLFSRCSI